MKKNIVLSMVGICLAAMSGYAGDIDAQAIWDKQCKKCHGDKGAADTKLGEKLEIKDYTKAESLADWSDEDLHKATKDGVEGSKMKGYGDKLSDEEIDALVVLMRSMAK